MSGGSLGAGIRSASGRFNLGKLRDNLMDKNSGSSSGGIGHNKEDTGSVSNSTSYDKPTSPHRERTFSSSGGGGNGGGGEKGDGLGKILKRQVAHATLIPSIGNQQLRPLQDLITAEKGILQSHERLSSDIQKGCLALSTWGDTEGSDLSDVLSHASAVMMHLSAAMTKYAEHEQAVRVLFKSIRTREEELEDLVKRRRNLGSRAEKEEKKLAKMGQENKSLPAQTELLEFLRDQMRQMDTEILVEESKVADFKRITAKEALGLKFGGCLELAEKATIVGELGKLLIEEIPLEETPPGYGRAPYQGFEQTQRLSLEAAKCVAEVQFHPTEVKSIPAATQNHLPRTPNPHSNEVEADDYRRMADAYGDDPAHDQGGDPAENSAREVDRLRQLRQGYQAEQLSAVAPDPVYQYHPQTGSYDLEGASHSHQKSNVGKASGNHVMFAAPTSPEMSARDRDPYGGVSRSYLPDPPSGSSQGLSSHDYEYQQAKEAELERYNHEGNGTGPNGEEEVTPTTAAPASARNPWDTQDSHLASNQHFSQDQNQPSTTTLGTAGDSTMIDSEEGLPYLSGSKRDSVDSAQTGGTTGKGSIMNRGRMGRRYGEPSGDGTSGGYNYGYEETNFFVRNHATSPAQLPATEQVFPPPSPAPTRPSITTQPTEEVLATAAAEREVARERDMFGVSGDDQFYTPTTPTAQAIPPPTAPALSERVPGARTISASAFKRKGTGATPASPAATGGSSRFPDDLDDVGVGATPPLNLAGNRTSKRGSTGAGSLPGSNRVSIDSLRNAAPAGNGGVAQDAHGVPEELPLPPPVYEHGLR